MCVILRGFWLLCKNAINLSIQVMSVFFSDYFFGLNFQKDYCLTENNVHVFVFFIGQTTLPRIVQFTCCQIL